MTPLSLHVLNALKMKKKEKYCSWPNNSVLCVIHVYSEKVVEVNGRNMHIVERNWKSIFQRQTNNVFYI